MLEFKQTDTAAVMILTLTELVTLTDPNYLFIFKHVTTKDIVAFVKSGVDDESDYPARYNQFTIDPVLFAGQPTGEWHYQVYEQADNSNLDPFLSGGLLEEGKLYVDRDPAFSFTTYNTSTTYKAYNG